MIHKLRIQKGFGLFLTLILLVSSAFSLHAQNQLDAKFKENANIEEDMEYRTPNNYHGIVVQSCYNANENLQSSFYHCIKHEKHDIVIAFALIPHKLDTTSRGKRIRRAGGNPYEINLLVVENEGDTTLTEMKYLDTLQLKKMNADRGVIYNVRVLNKYMGKYAKCKKITIYKDDVGRSEILFFYNKDDDAIVDEEIKKTWGMLKFK